jgi:DNA-binding CsgD family transcriptional regulator
METLTARDLYTVLDVAHELAGTDELDQFRARLLTQVRRLVPCDIASWNIIAPNSREAQISAVDPSDCRLEGDEQVLGAYAHQNPLIATAVPGAVRKFSDFITLRQLHRLEIYDGVYRATAVEHQLAFILPAPRERVIGVALNRNRPDFSERDRKVLEVAAPLITHAYERAASLGRLHGELDALGRATDAASHAIIVLHPDGHVQYASTAARACLRELPNADRPTLLPEPLAAWCEAQRARARQTPLLAETLRFGNWTARFVPGTTPGFDAIVIAQPDHLRPALLREAGLTKRESEILTLVASGLSNAQIARELTLSEPTIAKHLQHTYAKLDVTNRTAAVARAREHSMGQSRG